MPNLKSTGASHYAKTYSIKTAPDDVKHAMEKLENHIPEAAQTIRDTHGTVDSQKQPAVQTIQEAEYAA